jgi:hypothetical protein
VTSTLTVSGINVVLVSGRLRDCAAQGLGEVDVTKNGDRIAAGRHDSSRLVNTLHDAGNGDAVDDAARDGEQFVVIQFDKDFVCHGLVSSYEDESRARNWLNAEERVPYGIRDQRLGT